MKRARQIGLDGICITDHHSRAAARIIEEGPQDDGLVVLVGQEYTTDQGDFLLFGPLPELTPNMPAPQLLQMAAQAGGVAIGAHPCRHGRSLDPELAASGLLHFIEGVNGRNLMEANHLASGWGRDKGLGLVGGSDAHTPAEIGTVFTDFAEPVYSQKDLVRALMSGGFQAHWSTESDINLFHAARVAAASMAG